MPERARVVVMVKVPAAGRVKTRLGRDIGMTEAAWWFRHRVARLLRKIRDPRWDLVLAVSPDDAGLAFRRWPRDIPRIRQGHGDLGARMRRVFHGLRPGRAVIVGADVPGISRDHLRDAFRELGRADAVLGPAMDGGYWLIGFRHPRRLPARAFRGVRWSGPHARADTEASLASLRIAVTHCLSDVDTGADLAQSPRDAPGGAC